MMDPILIASAKLPEVVFGLHPVLCEPLACDLLFTGKHSFLHVDHPGHERSLVGQDTGNLDDPMERVLTKALALTLSGFLSFSPKAWIVSRSANSSCSLQVPPLTYSPCIS